MSNTELLQRLFADCEVQPTIVILPPGWDKETAWIKAASEPLPEGIGFTTGRFIDGKEVEEPAT